MNYSKSPSRTLKIKSESYLRPKVVEPKADQCRKLQDELFAILKQNKDLQSKIAKLQTETAAMVQTNKEENKAFLTRLKKAVDHKSAQRAVMGANDPFVGKHMEQIREALGRRGYTVEESARTIEKSPSRNDFGRGEQLLTPTASLRSTRLQSLESETPTTDAQRQSQPQLETSAILTVLEAHGLRTLPSNLRAMAHARLLESTK